MSVINIAIVNAIVIAIVIVIVIGIVKKFGSYYLQFNIHTIYYLNLPSKGMAKPDLGVASTTIISNTK